MIALLVVDMGVVAAEVVLVLLEDDDRDAAAPEDDNLCVEPVEAIVETFAICTVIVASLSSSPLCNFPCLSTKRTPRPASPREVNTCIPTMPEVLSNTIS